jgi:nitrate reductase gamma subunit
MMWAGLLIIPVGVLLGTVNASRTVDIVLLILLFAIAFAGLGVVLYGNSVAGRDADR